MNKPKIITISGSARHGKDTTASILRTLLNEKYKRVLQVNYADYVKFVSAMYIDRDYELSNEELVSNMYEKNSENRTKWQHVGTEKVRDRYPDFWVDTVIRLVNVFVDDYDYILIPDCRFPNEITRWQDEGFNITSLHVERLNFDNGLSEEQKAHRSETSLNDYKFDKYIQVSTIDNLNRCIFNLANDLL